MPEFKLRFATGRVREIAARYEYTEHEQPVMRVGEAARARGYLTHDELRALARWKTPRSAPRVARNDAAFVRETTRVALSTPSERLRIEALRLLDGVDWPTASVILHLAHTDRYPILDYRALWSVGVSPAPRYSFKLWAAYVAFTRAIARRAKLSMRELDRALWQFSKERQR